MSAASALAPGCLNRSQTEARRWGEGCDGFQRCVVVLGDSSGWKQVQEDIVALARGCEFDEHEQFAIHLSVEEALVNAVKHGNGCDPSKKIHIDYTVDSLEARVRISDEGAGFDLNAVPDPRLPEYLERPSGRGLLLMRYYMSAVRFNERGNSVELWKRRGDLRKGVVV